MRDESDSFSPPEFSPIVERRIEETAGIHEWQGRRLLGLDDSGGSMARSSPSHPSQPLQSVSVSPETVPPVHTAPATPTLPSKWSIDEFEVGSQLGRGAYSTVYCAQEKSSRFVVALKTLKKRVLTEKHLWSQLKTEVDTHRALSHTNIVKLFACFSDARKVYLAVEYCPGGQLCERIGATGVHRLEAVSYIVQIVSALKYLHALGYVHRDLKPENMLLDKTGRLRLCDFGWTVLASRTDMLDIVCGTLDYMAPELLQPGTLRGKGLDCWALGIVTHEVLTGRTPFYKKSARDTCTSIAQDVYVPGKVAGDAADFIGALLVKDAVHRMSIEATDRHKFLAPILLG